MHNAIQGKYCHFIYISQCVLCTIYVGFFMYVYIHA